MRRSQATYSPTASPTRKTKSSVRPERCWRDPAGPEGTRFELTLTAALRRESSTYSLACPCSIMRRSGSGAHQRLEAACWGGARSGRSLGLNEKVCVDRTYGNAGSQVDFIFVVDGSGSMEEEKRRWRRRSTICRRR